MRTKQQIIDELLNPGVIAIIRAKRAEQALPLAEALLAGGIVAIEITTTTPNAIAAIRDTSAQLGERALIGVGTVLDEATCRAAIDAGAQFIVSPICRRELIPIAHRAGKPVMLGAYTPTEAQLAHEAGSDFIKIFPADSLGPSYLKALCAPLPHLKIVPTGGVDLKTIDAFFKAGCVAVGAGSSLISKDILENDDWAKLTHGAAEFVRAAKAAKSS
jgi:2-dehydro-3-deoxyphosphogluconate aldolase / (4S)-4-hydroxy-2-oxoglutarate aldolase